MLKKPPEIGGLTHKIRKIVFSYFRCPVFAFSVSRFTGKKAVTSWLASDIHWTPTTPLAELVAISVPPQTERKHIILDNDSPEAITALADHLKKSLN